MKVFGLLSIAAILTTSFNANDDGMNYYKPKYNEDNYYTILSSGTVNKIHETWGVDKDDIDELPVLDLREIRFHEFVEKAKEHLEKKLENITLTLEEIKLDRITDKDLGNDRNWFVLITFRYNEGRYAQMVPMLIDGKIILSTNE